MEINVTKGQAKAEVQVSQAVEYARLVVAGVPPDDAAKQVGRSAPDMLTSVIVRKWLENTLPWFFDKAEYRRALVIASMTKILATGEDKDKVGAARVLINDPELGFKIDGPKITIEISEELRKIPADELWPEEDKNKK